MPALAQHRSFTHVVRWLIVGWLIMSALGCGRDDPPDASPAPHPISSFAPLRVQIAPAKLDTLDATLTRSGVAHALQSATIAAEVPGRVTSRPVHVGDSVEQGAVLAQVDSSAIVLDLQHARAAVEARESDLRFAESELNRTKQLFDANALADLHLDRAEYETQRARDGLRLARASAAKAADAHRRATIRASFAGIVVACHVDPGDYVAPGKPVVTIADLSKVVIVVGLSTADAAQVEPGTSMEVVFDSLGGLQVDATVRGRAPAPDPTTGTYSAELVAANPDARILDGVLARVRMPAQQRKALLIPKAALTRFDGSPAVFVVMERGESLQVLRKLVRLGDEMGDRVEVTEGIEPGERVVVEGVFALRDGAAVQLEGDSLAVAN